MKIQTEHKIPVLIDDDLIELFAEEYHAAGGEAVGITFGLYAEGRAMGAFEPLAPLSGEVSHVA